MDLDAQLMHTTTQARAAAHVLAGATTTQREHALRCVRAALLAQREEIEAANTKDVEGYKSNQDLDPVLLGRLGICGKSFDSMLNKIDEVMSQKDLVGIETLKTRLADGLVLRRVSCPIGVICVIFESRPDAVVQVLPPTPSETCNEETQYWKF